MKFVPVVENHLGKEDKAFLTDYPKNILLTKDIELVPWMVGLTSSDGALLKAFLPDSFEAGEKTFTSKTSNKLLPSWNCNGYSHQKGLSFETVLNHSN